jgi:serine/threonine protein kinase
MTEPGSVNPNHGDFWTEHTERPKTKAHTKMSDKMSDITNKALESHQLPQKRIDLKNKKICQEVSKENSFNTLLDHFEDGAYIKGFSRLNPQNERSALEELQRIQAALPGSRCDKAIKKILSYTEALAQIDNKLTFHERLKIACIVEEHFLEGKKSGPHIEYLSQTASTSARALVLDHNKQQFLVLSKEHGSLNAEGAERKVSSATLLYRQNDKVITKEYVRLVNIDPETVAHTRKEIEIAEALHQDIFLVVEHTTKSGKAKISVFEERYESNVERAGELSAMQIRSVIKKCVEDLAFLHNNGYVHGDINGSNILIKDLQEKELHAKLTDFGKTYNVDDDEMPKQDDKGYGSASFSSPESFGASSPISDPFEEGQAEDLFALGCTLYLMLYPNEKKLPWGPEVDAAIERGTDDANAQATKRYEKGIFDLAERAKVETDSEKKKLIETALSLLQSNPNKRMTLQKLQEQLD